MDPKLKIYLDADRVVTGSNATSAEIEAAIASVDALHDEEMSTAIRQSAGEWRAMAADYQASAPAPTTPPLDPLLRLQRARRS